MGDDRTDFIATLPKGGIGAEIGVWKGDFSQQALDGCSPSKLYLVDPWEKNDDKTNFTSTVAKSQAEIDAVHDAVVKRFAGDDRVEIVRLTSVAAAEFLLEIAFDWVYIDSVHSYEAVAQDLPLWWQRIKPGGVLSGHDIAKEGVRRAVLEFTIRHELPFDVTGNSYSIQKITD